MGWQLKNGQLYFNEILITDSTIVLAAENKENKLINGVQLQPPSTDLPNISFSCCHFYSSVEAMVYTPKIKETKVPYFVYVVTDPNFKKHEYPFPITADYLICDNLFLLLDDSVVNATKELQEIIIPGRVDYGKLPLLYKSRNDILHFVQDDLKCPSFEKKEISAPSSGITLYPYQVNGVSWMASVVSEGVGCVLADEMGLGKTFQIIALLECEKEHGISLVVAPGALLDNWKREFLKLAPRMSVLIHRGNKRLRYYKEFLGYDVIIVSYDTVKVDFSVFSQIVWNILVIDEAQSIKNQGSMRSQIIREFRKRAGIAVTGTPFENHVTDIWSIYDFCYRDLLGTSSQFKKQFIDDEKSAETLERIITPLLLRRLVKDVKKELPEKVLVSTPISMEESEAEYYEMIRKNNTFSSTGSNLGAINKLLQVCSSTYVEDEPSTKKYSTKFLVLIDLLDEIYAQHEKVIVFSKYVKTLKDISNLVVQKYCCEASILNGSVKNEERQRVVDDFSNRIGFSLMAINPTVGGTGLNITAANHVIFYSLEWNPALEDQCLARSLRIGQEKVVFIHRLFYADTIEDVVNERLSRKRELSGIVVHGNVGDDVDIKKALTLSPFTRGI